jgi:hypothetical protein
MVSQWGKGERPLTEDYLALYPGLRDRPAAVMELIYEEFCLRQENGEDADPQRFLERFPAWGDRLRVVLDCHQLLAEPPEHQPAVVGETLGEFQLLAELGRGARGQVFLATQISLARRLVVLKVAHSEGAEHLSLARLQHTHIVPLYSVQDHPERHLRALCMPYFGGTTLERLLTALRATPLDQRTGHQFIEALRAARGAIPVAPPVAGPSCDFLAQSSYVRALCWLGTCLADALQ